MSLNIVTRDQWGFTGWNGTPYSWPDNQRTEFYIHYDGGNPVNRTGNSVPQTIDAEHKANGWSGIGYNFVIDQHGTIFEGRGWSLVGAHCPNHNRSAWGVQIAIGDGQTPPDVALSVADDLYLEACARAGHALAKRGHRDGYSTECPGDKLYAWVQAGMPRPGGGVITPPQPGPKPKPGVSAPAFPLPSGSYFGPKSGPAQSVSGYYSHRNDLAQWQTRMSARGWTITADGLYGPQTASVATHFQREKGLAVDGLIGPQTWATAWTAPITA